MQPVIEFDVAWIALERTKIRVRSLSSARCRPEARNICHVWVKSARTGTVSVDFTVTAEAHRIGRPHNIRRESLVVTVAGRAPGNLVGLRRRVMIRRLMTLDAALVERFSMRLAPAKQRHQADRIRSQRLKTLVANQAVVVPRRMSRRKPTRRRLLLCLPPANQQPAHISRRNRHDNS